MKKNILISLVSDQTLPNLELIKEFSGFINEYIFVHSEQTKMQLKWIIRAANILEYKSFSVNAFDISDIEAKLKEYEFQDDEYYLNITGGTKLMILTFQEFFKNLGAKIFYLTGQNLEYIKVFPVIGERKFQLKSRITLNEYLLVYGFEIKSSLPIKDFKQSQKMLTYFLENNIRDKISVIEQIRMKRGKILIFQNFRKSQHL